MATMYVYNIPTNETVNLRSSRDTSVSNVLVRVPYGAAVSATAYDSTWHSASYSGFSGYIMSMYLTATNPNGGGTGTWVTRWTNTPGETVNIRSGPGTTYSINTKYSHGTKVEVNTPSDTWSQVRLSGSTTVAGYVMTTYLVASDPGSSGGGGTTPSGTLMYGTVKGTGYLNVRDKSSGGSSIAKLPAGRLVVYDSAAENGFVKIQWRNKSSAWVMLSYLTNTKAAAANARLRLADIGIQEETATTIVNGSDPVQEEEFYGAPLSTPSVRINYCHYFADTLASTAWYKTSNLPMEANCKNGVIFFLKAGGFYFVSSTHKSEIWNGVADMKQYMDSGSLSTKDKGYTPQPGDYIYFRRIAGETSSHVGIVTAVKTTSIETIEGNVGTNYAVGKRTYTYNPSANPKTYASDILGFGRPAL